MRGMKFAILTCDEIEGADIEWHGDAPKSADIVDAGMNRVGFWGGFSEEEIRAAPLGVLRADFELGGTLFRAGAVALAFTNGTTLLQIPNPLA
jgi:hypothetical protein